MRKFILSLVLLLGCASQPAPDYSCDHVYNKAPCVEHRIENPRRGFVSWCRKCPRRFHINCEKKKK